MNAELHASPEGHESRPNVSGDLPTLFEAAPMFRRTVAGYDRFQVDTYVQWAEDQLATAEREREHLLATHVQTRAALDDAQQLLSHSAAGAEFHRVSRRIGSLLAVATDEAEAMHAEAEAAMTAAAEQAEQLVASARQQLAEAAADAARVRSEAVTDAATVAAEAGRLRKEAEQTTRDARAEADARLAEVQVLEQRAAAAADEVRQRALAEASAARLQAREEVLGMLATAREDRRRADEEAAATRDRLEGQALALRALLMAEVEELQHRRSVLLADLARRDRLTPPAPDDAAASVRGQGERFAKWLESRVAHRRSAPAPAPAGVVRHHRGRS